MEMAPVFFSFDYIFGASIVDYCQMPEWGTLSGLQDEGKMTLTIHPFSVSASGRRQGGEHGDW
jgi:hypothetical protein